MPDESRIQLPGSERAPMEGAKVTGPTDPGQMVVAVSARHSLSLRTSLRSRHRFRELSGRGVPDVSGDADPNTGYNILVDGEQGVIGGTSAVAPFWAGLVAVLNEQLGRRLGFVNPVLYALQEPSNGSNDVTQGNNGAFSAGPGWDPCTGLGSPIGTALATLLATLPVS